MARWPIPKWPGGPPCNDEVDHAGGGDSSAPALYLGPCQKCSLHNGQPGHWHNPPRTSLSTPFPKGLAQHIKLDAHRTDNEHMFNATVKYKTNLDGPVGVLNS